jgi:hypothetical protein
MRCGRLLTAQAPCDSCLQSLGLACVFCAEQKRADAGGRLFAPVRPPAMSGQ